MYVFYFTSFSLECLGLFFLFFGLAFEWSKVAGKSLYSPQFVLKVCSFFVLLKKSIRKLQLNNLAPPYYRKLMLHEFKALEINAV